MSLKTNIMLCRQIKYLTLKKSVPAGMLFFAFNSDLHNLTIIFKEISGDISYKILKVSANAKNS